MGTSLTGLTPSTTYDALIKVGDNGALSGTLKTLSDGLGNDSALALSTGAATITGTLAVSSNATLTSSGISVRLGSATANAGANILIAGASSTKNWSLGVQQNVSGALEFTPTATNGATTLGTTPAMVILDAGNVGIGTTSPTRTLDVNGVIRTQNAGSAGAPSIELGTSPQGNGLFSPTTNTLAFATNDNEVGRFTSDGYLRLSATSGGIQFNGDTAAANALDDYEEGTWTPVITASVTAPTGVSYSFRGGNYTKIGNRIIASCGFFITSVGTGGSGSLQISGLPFTTIGYGSYQEPTTRVQGGGWLSPSLAYSSYVYAQGTSNILEFRDGSNVDSPIPYSEVLAGTFMGLTIIYYV